MSESVLEKKSSLNTFLSKTNKVLSANHCLIHWLSRGGEIKDSWVIISIRVYLAFAIFLLGVSSQVHLLLNPYHNPVSLFVPVAYKDLDFFCRWWCLFSGLILLAIQFHLPFVLSFQFWVLSVNKNKIQTLWISVVSWSKYIMDSFWVLNLHDR